VYEALSERRAEIAARIEASYSPVRHVAALFVIASATVAVAAVGLHGVKVVELAVVPIAFTLANFGEWALHRYAMHAPVFPRAMYERHALTHHVLYTVDAFEVREARELRFVLMPWFALPGMIACVAPVVALLAFAWSPNAARLFVIVAVGYYMLYEVCHTLYHLPSGAPVARTRLVRALRRLHWVHHDPSLMRRANFNVTFPIADAVLGTWRRER
jgi:fatty acid hydroxylase family protein